MSVYYWLSAVQCDYNQTITAIRFRVHILCGTLDYHFLYPNSTQVTVRITRKEVNYAHNTSLHKRVFFRLLPALEPTTILKTTKWWYTPNQKKTQPTCNIQPIFKMKCDYMSTVQHYRQYYKLHSTVYKQYKNNENAIKCILQLAIA